MSPSHQIRGSLTAPVAVSRARDPVQLHLLFLIAAHFLFPAQSLGSPRGVASKPWPSGRQGVSFCHAVTERARPAPATAQPSALYSFHFSLPAHSLGSENTTVMDWMITLVVCFSGNKDALNSVLFCHFSPYSVLILKTLVDYCVAYVILRLMMHELFSCVARCVLWCLYLEEITHPAKF